MQIHLKQPEIITALKQYISQQGINLTGKHVSISFTAGRKDTGVSADLNIEDADIPGFTYGDDETNEAPVATLTVVTETKEESLPVDTAEEVQPAKTTSLFGG